MTGPFYWACQAHTKTALRAVFVFSMKEKTAGAAAAIAAPARAHPSAVRRSRASSGQAAAIAAGQAQARAPNGAQGRACVSHGHSAMACFVFPAESHGSQGREPLGSWPRARSSQGQDPRWLIAKSHGPRL